MLKKLGFSVLLTTFGFAFLPEAQAQRARPGMAHSVGTGVVYPTLNHSLFVNPAALVDSPQFSLQGAYLLDPENIHSSLTMGRGAWGAGVGYRQAGDSSIEEFGLAFRLNILNLGVTARSSEFENFGFDTGFAFDLGSYRAAVVLRGVDDSISRIDAGIGFLVSQVTVEFNAKYHRNSETWLFDASVAAGDQVAVGLGHTFYYNSNADDSFQSGSFHAGLSVQATRSLSLEGFFRPHYQEWGPGDWVLGARYTF